MREVENEVGVKVLRGERKNMGLRGGGEKVVGYGERVMRRWEGGGKEVGDR